MEGILTAEVQGLMRKHPVAPDIPSSPPCASKHLCLVSPDPVMGPQATLWKHCCPLPFEPCMAQCQMYHIYVLIPVSVLHRHLQRVHPTLLSKEGLVKSGKRKRPTFAQQRQVEGGAGGSSKKASPDFGYHDWDPKTGHIPRDTDSTTQECKEKGSGSTHSPNQQDDYSGKAALLPCSLLLVAVPHGSLVLHPLMDDHNPMSPACHAPFCSGAG